MAVRYVSLLLFGLLVTAPAVAQAPLDTTVVLDEVTVTATRDAVHLVEAPVRVLVLGPEDIAATGMQHVGGLLEARGPAFIKRYGSGGLASISLRGATAGQTLVLLDGQRIVDPQLGQLDLSLLPTLLLRSVEVMPGAASALYGSDAIGGVVHLRTRAAEAGTQAVLQGGYGAFGERTAGARVEGASGRWSGLLVGEVEQSEGDYPYFDASQFPPQAVRREGADREMQSLFASGSYEAGTTRLRSAAWFTHAERGLPTIGGTQPRGERQEDTALRVWSGGEARLGPRPVRGGLLVQHKQLRYFTINPSGQIGADKTGRTVTASLEGEMRQLMGRRWLAIFGTTLGYGQARHPSLAERAREVRGGVFASGVGRYGRLRLYPALHADAYLLADGSSRLAFAPRLGLNVQPLAAFDAFHLKASAGRAFRVPTFNDRFWQPGGNPDLEPERGWTVDAGAAVERGAHRSELTFFTARTRDQIVWVPTDRGYWAPRNVREARVRGVEASAEQDVLLLRGLRLRTGLFATYTDARDRSDPDSRTYDQPLRYVPREQLKVHVGLRVGPIAADVNTRSVGRRYVTSDGSRWLDPYIVVDTRLSLHGRWDAVAGRITFLVANMLDEDYEVIASQPMPPRHARVQLTLQFH